MTGIFIIWCLSNHLCTSSVLISDFHYVCLLCVYVCVYVCVCVCACVCNIVLCGMSFDSLYGMERYDIVSYSMVLCVAQYIMILYSDCS